MSAVEPDWAMVARPNWRERVNNLFSFGVSPEMAAKRSGGRAIYLATPYSKVVVGPDGTWSHELSRDSAGRAACSAADLATAGATAISPVILADLMCRAEPGIARKPALDPLDDAFWSRWCQPILHGCGSIYVPDIPGWKESRGIWREVMWAITRGVPVMVQPKGS